MANCTDCWNASCIAIEPQRAHAASDAEVEMASAREISSAQWSTVSTPAYPALRLGRGALVVVVGAAGAGKSTMACRGLDSMRGPTVLLSVEEPIGPSLSDRLARVGCKRDDFYVVSRATVDQLVSTIRQKNVVALGVDSCQRAMFEPRDLRHLLTTCPTLSVIWAISQVNRDGEARGGEALPHEADVVVEVHQMRWRISKSRYQPEGEGVVLTPMSTPSTPASA